MNSVFLLASWALTTALYSVSIHGALLIVARSVILWPAHRVLLWRAALLAPAFAATVGVIGVMSKRTHENEISVTSGISRILPTRWTRRFLREDIESPARQRLVRTVSVSDPLAQSVSLVVLLTCAGGIVVSARRLMRRRSVELAALRMRVVLYPTRTIGGVDVLVSCAEVPSPIALRGREVCLPESGFFDMSDDEQQSVLLHEASHVERADAAWLELAHLISAILWWQPFNGGIISALVADTELAADDRALALGASATGLVSALMHLAANLPAPMNVGAAFVTGHLSLVKRSRRILGFPDPVPARSVRLLLKAVLVVGGIALLSLMPIPATSRGAPGKCSARATKAGCTFMRATDVEVVEK